MLVNRVAMLGKRTFNITHPSRHFTCHIPA